MANSEKIPQSPRTAAISCGSKAGVIRNARLAIVPFTVDERMHVDSYMC